MEAARSSTIAVTIGGGSVETDTLYLKTENGWKKVQPYKKPSASWSTIDAADAYDDGASYVRGN